MSLINDALKKAARQRAEEQADMAPIMPGGGGSRGRHGGPMSKQTMVLIGGAAVVLVVVSVVATGVFVTSRPTAKPAEPAAIVVAPVAAKPAPVVSVAVQAPPVVTVVVPKAAAPVPTPIPVPTAAPVVVVQPVPTEAPAPVAVARAPEPTAAPAAVTESRAERIQAYIDALQVTGARAAGSESKALVNGHVFKLNDVLDKTLGLRLKQVDADHLTFVDAAGDTYVKSY
jgi:hypothetical protein